MFILTKIRILITFLAMTIFSNPAAIAQGSLGLSKEAKISDGIVKIGMLVDMSSVYADLTGPGSVKAVKLAIEDIGGKILGKPIELVFADHQNKPDIASSIAREWFDTGKVDMIADVVGTAPALAVLDLAIQKNKIITMSGPASTILTNARCSPVSAHWVFDTHATAAGTARGMMQQGADSWFFVAVDNIFGKDLERDATEVIKKMGGKVLGQVYTPLNTLDFSSFILQAQASGAKVVATANGGGDTINAIKAANEFGLTKKQKLVATYILINDIHSLGLDIAKGMLLTEAFYWDLNNETRAWSRRFFSEMKKMPNMVQAGEYSSVFHYLKAVRDTGTDDTATVMAKMKSTPINGMLMKNVTLRGDGRVMNNMYLFEVKKPEESTAPWDYYKLKTVIPGKEAFLEAEKSTCKLLKR